LEDVFVHALETLKECIAKESHHQRQDKHQKERPCWSLPAAGTEDLTDIVIDDLGGSAVLRWR